MKKKLLATVLLLMGAAGSALAASGSVNFEGSITDKSCSLDTASQNQTIKLGSWAIEDFPSVGATSIPSKFTIKLIGCPTGVSGAGVRFDGTRQTHAGAFTDYLAITPGVGPTASGVAIGLSLEKVTGGSAFIPMNTSSERVAVVGSPPNATITIPLAAYYVRYASTVPVTAGSANATATFGIDYS